MCEDGIGYSGIWDPVYAIEPGTGTYIATTFRGIRVSEDGGCDWERRGGEHDVDWFSGQALRDDGAWFFCTASGGRTNGVFKSVDHALTLTATSLTSDTEFYRGLLFGPAGSNRGWVVGYSLDPLASTIYRSDDGGEHWTATSLALVDGTEIFTLGVDPSNPAILYYMQPAGEYWELRRTTDAGATTELLDTFADSIEAFAISEDGQTILAGTPGSEVRRSVDGGASFDPTATQIKAQCFTTDGDVVYACAENWDDGFAVGRSDDWGDTWTGIFRYDEIASPLPCPDCTSVDEICEPIFWTICDQFGLTGEACTRPSADAGPGLDCPSDAGPDAGADADADADSDSDADSDADGDIDSDGPAPPKKDDGCGCRAAGGSAAGVIGLVAAALLSGVRRRRAS
jgi:MYXO-CTERM domain-containing protein